MPSPATRLLLGSLLLAPLAAAGPQEQDDPLRFDEARVRAAWGRLGPKERAEAAEWLRFELSVSDSFQLELLRWALDLDARDPGLWPPLEPPPVFDPERHAPRQPIPRHALPAGSSRARRERERFLGEGPGAVPRPRWVYDWASGEVRHDPGVDPTEAAFENAVAGLPPEADLAVALVARALDDGRARELLHAFGHAYADRSGNVVPRVTLYDAWRSGETFETPDVEALGIVHAVLGEWERWRAPVPASGQEALYATLGELFRDARRYRGLRQALAELYLASEPPNADGYQANRLRLHALWEHARSEPERLAPLLPDAAGWESFLRDWDATCAADEELSATAVGRHWALSQGEQQVRRTLVWVLRELGAFGRGKPPEGESAPRGADDGR